MIPTDAEDSTVAEAMALVAQVARSEALMDAEKAVLDRRDKLQSFQLSEMRTLNLAAEAIARLRG